MLVPNVRRAFIVLLETIADKRKPLCGFAAMCKVAVVIWREQGATNLSSIIETHASTPSGFNIRALSAMAAS
jgi:hypothetical protein